MNAVSLVPTALKFKTGPDSINTTQDIIIRVIYSTVRSDKNRIFLTRSEACTVTVAEEGIWVEKFFLMFLITLINESPILQERVEAFHTCVQK